MFEQVLLTSVPSREVPWAAQALPGARLVSRPLSAEVAAAHPDARVLSVMVHDPVDVAVLERFPRLEAVVTRSTGYDHLPVGWLQARGVRALHLPGYATQSVAHLTVLFVLGLLRRVPEAMAVTQGGGRGGADPPTWDRSRLVGRHLGDVTVGVLGTGRIGGAVVRLLAGLGAQVVGHDLRPDPALRRVPRFRYVDPFPTFLMGCDVLTVHVPLTKATRHMVDEAALARLPPGALLVNTARGDVVDQTAVERALRSGRLAGYAADVLPGEPMVPGLRRFRDLGNVMLTPHVGAYDSGAIRARYAHTAMAARAVLTQDEPVLAGFRPPLDSEPSRPDQRPPHPDLRRPHA